MINIALINEFAMLCNKLKISVWEVIEAAKTKPFGFMPFYPGPGLGGHCIPCDPIYLSWKAKKIGFTTEMIDLSAYINRHMPKYVVERVRQILNLKKLQGKKILVVGVAYKKDVKDLRESPALDIIELFQKEKALVKYFDPFFPYVKIDGIDLKTAKLTKQEIKSADCVLIVTDHSSVNYGLILKNAKFIFDTRNVYKKDFSNLVRL